MRGLLMTFARLARRRARPFGAETRGVAAIEFAILLPLIITMYFGTVELSTVLAVDRKVSLATNALADLVAQDTAIDAGEMNDIFNAARAVMVPYDADRLTMRLTAIAIDGDGEATVLWSAAQGMSEFAADSTIGIPAELAIADTNLIRADVNFNYESIVGEYFSGITSLDDTQYLRPRFVVPAF